MAFAIFQSADGGLSGLVESGLHAKKSQAAETFLGHGHLVKVAMMKIEIVTKNVKNEDMVREFIQRKVQFALDRIGDRVKSIVVRLEDETKDSEAFDGLCQIDVSLIPTGDIHVSAHGDSAFDSVLQATRKMQHAIKHNLDRHRRSSRVRHQQTKQDFYSSLAEDEAEPRDDAAIQ